MPDFKILAHKKVLKFLQSVKDETLKNRIKEVLLELEDYPIALRKLDIEKLEGLDKAYRIRIGEYRVIFVVDKKQRIIFITHIGKRESIYEK